MKRNYRFLAVGNAVLALADTAAPGEFDDLVHSVLLAQRVADRKIEKDAEQNWYDAYVEVLDEFWMRSLKARLDLSPSGAGSDTPLQWVSGALADEALDVADALSCIAHLPFAAPAITAAPDGGEVGQEEVAPAQVRLLALMAHGPTAFTGVHVEFKTRQPLAGNPWSQCLHHDALEGGIVVRLAKANLSQTLYGLSREAVALKVKGLLSECVVPLASPEREP